MSHQTIVEYTGGIPTVTGTVTLFSSVAAFPPGGSFHLLGQQWFQYTLRVASDGGTGTGTVTGEYSVDKGVTWIPYYSLATTDADDDVAAAVADVIEDEVYVGMFKDVRFRFTNAVEVPTIFQVQMALNCHKATSKVVATGSTIGGNL
jgi:hypothetical protein